MAIEIQKELQKILDQYGEKVDRVVEDAVDKTAKDTARELRNTSPKRYGDYARSWTSKKDGKKGRIVHNRDHYQLTHLLENGHVIRNGVGTYGRTRPIKHIEPAEQKGIEEFEDRIRRGLK